MIKNNRFYKTFATLFMLLVLWGTFFVSSLLLKHHSNDNIDFIPKDAFFVTRIDGRMILKEGMRTVILQEDNEVASLFEKITKSQSTTKSASKRTGINLNSDIIIFSTIKDNQKYFGFLFNLSSPSRFEKNIPNLLKKNQGFAIKNEVGLLLTAVSSPKTKKIQSKQINAYASTILNKQKEFSFKENLTFDSKKLIAQTWSKKGLFKNGDVISSSNLSFAINNHTLELNGTLEIENQKKSLIKYQLKPNGFHLTVVQLSEIGGDSIANFLERFNLQSAQLNGLSLNYYGTEIIEEPSFVIVPKFDALLYFETEFDLKQNLDSLLSQSLIDDFNNKYVLYGGVKFYYRQLDQKTFYIGRSVSPEYIPFDNKIIFEISGPLEPLTYVSGDGMMRKLLEIVSIFSASKSLSKKVDNISIKASKEEGNSVSLKGIVHFKEEVYPLNALIKFGFGSQLIK